MKAAIIYIGLMTGFLLAPQMSVADPLPGPVDFSLPRIGGGQAAVKEFRGQWVVLNYWATWCAPCRKEIPELSKLHDERTDITVLGLAYEDTDEAAFVEFLAEFDVTYPVLRVDVYQPPEPFGPPKALPTTIVLDQQGYTVKTFLGPVTRESIETFIDGESAGPVATAVR